jgi:DNA-binding MarR family transcriptional regulator
MRTIYPPDILQDGRELFEILRELGRKRSLRDPIATAVEQMRFTPAQVHSILWLGTDGAMTMGDIATRLGITEKTITGVIDRLEDEQLVKRQRGARDRRVIQVVLTRKGAGVHRRISAALDQKMLFLMSQLDPGQRRSLLDIMRTLSTRVIAATAAQRGA